MSKIKYIKKTGQLLFGKLDQMSGIQKIQDDGLACFEKRYSLYYTVQAKENSTGLFELLRFYDIPFRFLLDLKEKQAYLGISEEYETSLQAAEDLDILEKDIQKNLPKGYSLHRLGLSERLHLLHRISVGENAYINTDNYTKAGEWLNDISLQAVKEQGERLSFGSEGTCFYQVIACKKPETFDQIPEDTRYILLDCSSISNHAMKLFMEENYLGLEEMERSIEKKPSLHEVLFGRADTDSRLFTLCGLYLIRTGEDLEFKRRQPAECMVCYGTQKQMFQSFLPAGRCRASQMHVCESGQINKLADLLLRKGGTCQ